MRFQHVPVRVLCLLPIAALLAAHLSLTLVLYVQMSFCLQ